MDRGFNTALISMMKDEIVKGLEEKESQYNELARETGDNSVLKLSHVSSSMAIAEAKVIVLKIAEKLMTKEHDELIKELNEMIEEARAKS